MVAHPSLLKVPDDLETLKAKSQVPMLWNIAEHDYMVRRPDPAPSVVSQRSSLSTLSSQYTPAAADEADKVFAGSKLCSSPLLLEL